MKNKYDPAAIGLLTGLMAGKEENLKQLIDNGTPELALLYDAVRGNQKIIPILFARKEVVLASFLSAILSDDRKAIPFLLSSGAPQWAATANLVRKDPEARLWLRRNNLSHYASLGDAIIKRMQEEEGSGFEWLYKGPFSQ